MANEQIVLKLFQLRTELIKKRIYPDVVILFGSWASGKQRKDSDVDVAIVSRALGKDRLKEGAKLNFIASKIDSRFEVVPISLKEYLNPNSISPILAEIKKHGEVIF